MTDNNIETSIKDFLKLFRVDEELYLFTYGSLVFEPCFQYTTKFRAIAKNYHRNMCIKSETNLGTKENPGLLFGLDIGGKCTGLVYKLRKESYKESLLAIWNQEMSDNAYVPVKLEGVYSVPEEQKFPFSPITFMANRESEHYVSISYEEKIKTIKRATGEKGSNLDYIINLRNNLKKNNIEDLEFEILVKELKGERLSVDDFAKL